MPLPKLLASRALAGSDFARWLRFEGVQVLLSFLVLLWLIFIGVKTSFGRKAVVNGGGVN